jgi:hypothetical protein
LEPNALLVLVFDKSISDVVASYSAEESLHVYLVDAGTLLLDDLKGLEKLSVLVHRIFKSAFSTLVAFLSLLVLQVDAVNRALGFL